MTEVWKNVKDFPGYQVSNMGRLKLKSGTISRSKPTSDGYIKPQLRKNGSPFSKYLHDLIGKVFIPNPDNKKFINHKNGIRHDNRVKNLEWVTSKENNNKRTKPPVLGNGRKVIQFNMKGKQLKIWNTMTEAANALGTTKQCIYNVCSGRAKSAKQFKWKYYEEKIDDEEWRSMIVDGEKEINVSSHGRVKTTTGVITVGGKHCDYFSIKINSKHYSVHRLICLAFKPIENPDDYVVNHKDNNGFNNHIDNLEWCTQSENRLHAQQFRTIQGVHTRKVEQLTPNGVKIGTYNSITEASQKTGVNMGDICGVCRGYGYSKTAGSFIWRYIDEE